MAEPKTEVIGGKTVHCSAGAVIVKNEKFFLIDRAVAPYGFAGVAGHVDEGETPEEALVREVEEETGLSLRSKTLLFDEFVDWNWCSRGVTGHHWYVYRCEAEGEVRENAGEVKSYGWYDREAMQRLTLEPVWRYWFTKMNAL